MKTIKRPQLLVSVRNVYEAKEAIAGGCEWLDFKEPHAGALGRPSLVAENEIVAFLKATLPSIPVSFALGEYVDWNFREQNRIPFSFDAPFFKIGLSQLEPKRNWEQSLEECLQTVPQPSRFVPVYYADQKRAQSPLVETILSIASNMKSRYFLIDTFEKDASTLLDWISIDRLNQISRKCHQSGMKLALAGRVSVEILQELLKVHFDILGVRTAVCEKQNRTAGVTQESVQSFLNTMENIW